MSEGSPVAQPCCDDWGKAHEWGTDNEGHSALVSYSDGTRIGYDLAPVRLCPWCGAGKGDSAIALTKHPTGIIAKFENNTISIQIEWGDSDTFIELSDQFMAGVRAHYTEDLIGALKAFAAEPLSNEPGHSRTRLFSFEDLDEKIRRARAALEKVGER